MQSTFDTLWQAFDSILKENKESKLESTEFENYLLTGGIAMAKAGNAHSTLTSLKAETRRSVYTFTFREIHLVFMS